jgi:hypothetical protein
MKWLAAIILIVSAARAAQTNWPAARADGKAKPEKVKVEKFKVKAEKQKGGKTKRREFPLMFDIVDKAAKHKAKKAKQKGDK